MAFCVIHLLKITVIANGFDPLLKGDDFIVASHHRHRAKLQAFCQMHGAD